jgi:D-inositol-3-phosphate glycosyltransferase
MVSVHTSPLEQPGTGDAGGMNVYIVELAKRLAALDIEVDIFTRATSASLPPTVELADGVLVRHVTAGPYKGLAKHELPTQLRAFAQGVLRASAGHRPGGYDLVHSHYWLSGHVGSVVASHWGVPLVHAMHTMAKVKNASLAEGDSPEPASRVRGEAGAVRAADRLIANTRKEAEELLHYYEADPGKVAVLHPGVDLDRFRVDASCVQAERSLARARLGLPQDALIPLFVGRIQPLKAPDVLLRAVAALLEQRPQLRDRIVVPVVGGQSGNPAHPEDLEKLAAFLGISDAVLFRPPVAQAQLADWYRAASALVMPSYNESFGLVAIEAQACGTPVIAAAVGGLPVAVRDGTTGVLVRSHDPADYTRALRGFADDPALSARMGAAAALHAQSFGWDATATATANVYATAMRERSTTAMKSSNSLFR